MNAKIVTLVTLLGSVSAAHAMGNMPTEIKRNILEFLPLDEHKTVVTAITTNRNEFNYLMRPALFSYIKQIAHLIMTIEAANPSLSSRVIKRVLRDIQNPQPLYQIMANHLQLIMSKHPTHDNIRLAACLMIVMQELSAPRAQGQEQRNQALMLLTRTDDPVTAGLLLRAALGAMPPDQTIPCDYDFDEQLYEFFSQHNINPGKLLKNNGYDDNVSLGVLFHANRIAMSAVAATENFEYIGDVSNNYRPINKCVDLREVIGGAQQDLCAAVDRLNQIV